MSRREVQTLAELKAAVQSDATEITTTDPDLQTKLRLIASIQKYGPWAVAAAVAAIPVLVATAPVSAPAGMAALAFTGGAGAAGGGTFAGLAVMALAIGGTVLIGILTDWECVEIGDYIKLKRKSKS